IPPVSISFADLYSQTSNNNDLLKNTLAFVAGGFQYSINYGQILKPISIDGYELDMKNIVSFITERQLDAAESALIGLKQKITNAQLDIILNGKGVFLDDTIIDSVADLERRQHLGWGIFHKDKEYLLLDENRLKEGLNKIGNDISLGWNTTNLLRSNDVSVVSELYQMGACVSASGHLDVCGLSLSVDEAIDFIGVARKSLNWLDMISTIHSYADIAVTSFMNSLPAGMEILKEQELVQTLPKKALENCISKLWDKLTDNHIDVMDGLISLEKSISQLDSSKDVQSLKNEMINLVNNNKNIPKAVREKLIKQIEEDKSSNSLNLGVNMFSSLEIMKMTILEHKNNQQAQVEKKFFEKASNKDKQVYLAQMKIIEDYQKNGGNMNNLKGKKVFVIDEKTWTLKETTIK
ncbi:MAG: hypothetical protein IJM09_03120, partial [Neisseriaceae bacterium]|nr:hypothetical protein [Neisseriaceae bacterium]